MAGSAVNTTSASNETMKNATEVSATVHTGDGERWVAASPLGADAGTREEAGEPVGIVVMAMRLPPCRIGRIGGRRLSGACRPPDSPLQHARFTKIDSYE